MNISELGGTGGEKPQKGDTEIMTKAEIEKNQRAAIEDFELKEKLWKKRHDEALIEIDKSLDLITLFGAIKKAENIDDLSSEEIIGQVNQALETYKFRVFNKELAPMKALEIILVKIIREKVQEIIEFKPEIFT